MSIVHVMATIRCDGCNKPFVIKLDLAHKRPADWSLHEEVEDEVRGGNTEVGMTSVQAGHLCCEDCTRFIDNHFPEEVETADLTHDMVCGAFNKRAGI